MNNTCDCIIPFYNEDLRPINVVKSIIGIQGISKIITIDDGSTNETTYLELRSKYPQVTSIRLERNKGKANAVKEGLKCSTAPYVLLLDGDLTNIKANELENAIQKITNNSQVDMIVLRRITDKTVVISRWIRHDTIFSGQRILRKDDLEKVFINNIQGYKLESAINTYMLKGNRTCYWMPCSIHNPFKHQKWGFIDGILKIGIPGLVSFMSSRDIIRQTLFFCRQEAP